MMDAFIQNRVHELYWKDDINCARTTLTCLCELYGVKLEQQTLHSAIGLHGAGGFRAQCGLVEGTLMFIGIYFSDHGKSEQEISSLCRRFAEGFTAKFGSLKCFDLRPNGFTANDPPHACERLTCAAIDFANEWIKNQT